MRVQFVYFKFLEILLLRQTSLREEQLHELLQGKLLQRVDYRVQLIARLCGAHIVITSNYF
jgi:hypothetical protein